MKAIFFVRVAALTLLLGSLLPAQAQWLTQTNVIQPGWTAVYFNVDASGQSLNTLVAFNPACPIDQIWAWKTAASPAQYLSNPAAPLAGDSHWLIYYRTNSGSVSSLGALGPNAAYLIHSSATTNYTWRVQGQPVPPNYVWDNTGLNFIGFSTPAAHPPTFQDFLAPAPWLVHNGTILQYVGGPMSTVPPLNPAPLLALYSTPVTRGQAFWVGDTNNLNNTYFGPFTLTLPNPSGLNYGTAGNQFTFHLLNTTTNLLVVSLSLLPSETPTYVQTNIADAPPLLVEGALNPSNLTYAATALTVNHSGSGTNSFSWTLAPSGQPGSDVPVTLGVNRSAMSAAGAYYAGILRFSDSLGLSEMNVPVSATATSLAGLWLGGVSISQVGSYLKSYGTNADGSLQSSALSTPVISTNPIPLLFTNLVINNSVSTNETASYFSVSNWVVNTYTTNQLTIATNSFVVGTNLVINTFALSNLVITSTPLSYTDNNGEIIWQMQITTNLTGQVYATTVTNALVFTNVLAAPVPNSTPEPVSVYQLTQETITNLVVTNAPLMNPVTNLMLSYLSFSNSQVITSPAQTALTTNLTPIVTSASFGIMTNYTLTNLSVAAFAVTNPVVTNTALYVVTNGMTVTSLSPLVNNYTTVNQYNQAFYTNVYVITNNYALAGGQTTLAGGSTNLLAATVNDLPGTPVSTTYSVTTLAETSQPAYVVQTNYLVSASSNYVVTAVNTSLGAVPVPLNFRLILFNDGTNSSLLQRVYVGVRGGTNTIVATTESVLDPSSLGTARRISAPILPWTAANAPYALAGTFSPSGALTSVPIMEAYDDQAGNPFLHTYHPDHNNLDYTYTPPHEQPRGSQSYDISQSITLTFTSGGSDFASLTKSDSSLSGTYSEIITLSGLGTASRTFNTAGAFSLVRVSPIATLTTQ